MFFHFIPGAFHINLLMGCELGAEPIRGRLASLDVLAAGCLKSSFKTHADWAIVNLEPGDFCRTTDLE